mgnify:CR=1 FL=1
MDNKNEETISVEYVKKILTDIKDLTDLAIEELHYGIGWKQNATIAQQKRTIADLEKEVIKLRERCGEIVDAQPIIDFFSDPKGTTI